MTNTHKRYAMDRQQTQDLLDREYKGSALIDTIMPNGDILINQDGSFRKMKADDVQKLTQRYVHIQEDNAQSNVSKVRGQIASDSLVQEGYDRNIRQGARTDGMDSNPFHGVNANRPKASTYGTPDAVKFHGATGLPSATEPASGGLPSSRNERHYMKGGQAITNGLPSAQRK